MCDRVCERFQPLRYRDRHLHRGAVSRRADAVRSTDDHAGSRVGQILELVDRERGCPFGRRAGLEVADCPPGERDASDILASAGGARAAGRRSEKPGADLWHVADATREGEPAAGGRGGGGELLPVTGRWSTARGLSVLTGDGDGADGVVIVLLVPTESLPEPVEVRAGRSVRRVGVVEPLARPVGRQVDPRLDAEIGREFRRLPAGDTDVWRLRGDDTGGAHGVFDAGRGRHGAGSSVPRHTAGVDADGAVRLDSTAVAGVESLVDFQPSERGFDCIERRSGRRAVVRGVVEGGLSGGRRPADPRSRPGAAVDDNAHTGARTA